MLWFIHGIWTAYMSMCCYLFWGAIPEFWAKMNILPHCWDINLDSDILRPKSNYVALASLEINVYFQSALTGNSLPSVSRL